MNEVAVINLEAYANRALLNIVNWDSSRTKSVHNEAPHHLIKSLKVIVLEVAKMPWMTASRIAKPPPPPS